MRAFYKHSRRARSCVHRHACLRCHGHHRPVLPTAQEVSVLRAGNSASDVQVRDVPLLGAPKSRARLGGAGW